MKRNDFYCGDGDVFREEIKQHEQKWLPACSGNGIHVNPRFPGVVFAGRVLVDAGGFSSSASGYLPRGQPADNGRTERTKKRMKEWYRVSHPSRHVGPFFSSSPAALDALLLPGSYSGKRDTDPAARRLPIKGWAESK